MIRGLTVVCLLALVSLPQFANAQPSDEVIVNTLRCEAGRVGQKLAELKGFPSNLKAVVTWTSTKTRDGALGAGFKFPFLPFGGSGDLNRQDIDELQSDGLSFNLHPENLQVCRGYRVQIVREGMGLYDCIIAKKPASFRAAVEGGTGFASCKQQMTLAKKLSGNARLNIWGVDLGPNASWGDTYLFKIVIAAPPPKK